MGVSRGKGFEGAVRKAAMMCPDVSIDRFPDPMAGYGGIRNICDFVVYRYPVQVYLECKAYTGNTLNFKAAITEDQWRGLLQKSTIEGVTAGVLVWFIDHDLTGFVPIQELERLKQDGHKSLNVNDLKDGEVVWMPLPGKKKRVYYEYTFEPFISCIVMKDLLKSMRRLSDGKEGKQQGS